jgi:hypothetical protein
MIVPFKPSSLYVAGPREMRGGDTETFSFDAKVPVASVTAQLVNLWTGAIVPLVATVSESNFGLVAVAGQQRGFSYDVIVTFVTNAGRTYSRALYVPVRK